MFLTGFSAMCTQVIVPVHCNNRAITFQYQFAGGPRKVRHIIHIIQYVTCVQSTVIRKRKIAVDPSKKKEKQRWMKKKIVLKHTSSRRDRKSISNDAYGTGNVRAICQRRVSDRKRTDNFEFISILSRRNTHRGCPEPFGIEIFS